MSNKPLILAQNIAALLTIATSPAGQSGYEKEKLVDNFDNTSFKPVGNTSAEITITGDQFIDTVVIESITADPAASITIQYNGANNFVAPVTGLKKGTNLFRAAAPIEVTSIVITITASAIDIRHLWTSIGLQTRDPLYGFYPEQNEIDGDDPESFFCIVNDVRSRTRILEASWSHLSGVELSAFMNLFEKSYLAGTPFWFWGRPEKEPENGWMFRFVQDEWENPFIITINKSISIKAVSRYDDPVTSIAYAVTDEMDDVIRGDGDSAQITDELDDVVTNTIITDELDDVITGDGDSAQITDELDDVTTNEIITDEMDDVVAS